MRHWRRNWYSLMGPLMIWAAFSVIVPILVGDAFISADVLPPLGVIAVKTISLFWVLVLTPLAALAEIAPPVVAREEVNWRNRNSDLLFEGDVGWEDVPFLPPVLNRIRLTSGKRTRRDEAQEVSTSHPHSSPT